MKQTTFHTMLKFAAHAAAAKDIRYYLNSVCFEFTDAGQLYMIGTDGHRMAVVGGTPDFGLPAQQVIVPIDKVKLMLDMAKGKTGKVSFGVDPGDAPGRPPVLSVRGEGGWVVTTHGVDGNYPDWHRVSHRGDEPKPQAEISMNADYIAAAAKACGAFGKKYAGVTITTYGSVLSAIRVAPHSIDDMDIFEAFCVVMPLRK